MSIYLMDMNIFLYSIFLVQDMWEVLLEKVNL